MSAPVPPCVNVLTQDGHALTIGPGTSPAFMRPSLDASTPEGRTGWAISAAIQMRVEEDIAALAVGYGGLP